MLTSPRTTLTRALLGMALLAARAPAPSLHAVELSAFVSSASPGTTWKRGYGAALGSTWFRIVHLEAELARQPLEAGTGGCTSFTAGAFLAPRIGPLQPYGGLGVGLFRQTSGTSSDSGRLNAFVVGVKAQVGLALVKGEYRDYNLSGTPLATLNRRLSLGVGLTF